MFNTEQFYEAKVFLRSYSDAIDCIKQTAQKEEEIAHYERIMHRIIEAKNNDQIEFKYDNVLQGKRFKDLKEYKLYQFSNQIFKKYFSTLETSGNDFKEVKRIVDDGLTKMRADSQ